MAAITYSSCNTSTLQPGLYNIKGGACVRDWESLTAPTNFLHDSYTLNLNLEHRLLFTQLQLRTLAANSLIGLLIATLVQ